VLVRTCADYQHLECVHLKSLQDVALEDFFEFDKSGRTRGHSFKLRKQRCRLDLRLHFFSERVITLWNKFDEQTVASTSLNGFKSNLTRLRNSSMGLLLDTSVQKP